MVDVHGLPPPIDLGGPSKYTEWRKGQGESFAQLVNDTRRIQVLAAPTGIGKSAVVVTYIAFTGKRGLIVTANKGLADQYEKDAREIGIVDVRGMGNYPCIAEGGTWGKKGEVVGAACDDGPCVDGGSCHLKELGCYYFDQVRKAERAELVVTNYAFLLTRRRNFQSLGKIDVLVLDEAHDIDDQLGKFLNVTLKPTEVAFPADAADLDVDGWRAWAAVVVGSVKIKMTHAPRYLRKKLRETVAKLEAVANLQGQWVIAPVYGGGWTFDPLWVGPYVAGWLFGDVPKIILASATIRPETIARLGISKDAYNFIEPKSPIPVLRRPVVHVASGVRMNFRTPDYEWMKVVRLMDDAHNARNDRKGLVHAVSYARAKDIVGRSDFADRMLLHDSHNTREIVEEFKRAAPPLILVSPAITTGWDFPFDAARYQLIPKVPFPDLRSPLMKARCAEDKKYMMHVVAQVLTQMAGRITRDPTDFGETLIYDDMVEWVVGRNRHLFARFFLMAWRWASVNPRPPVIPKVTQRIIS